MLAVIAARPARNLAAIADARGGRVARQFGELQRRRKALLDRLRLVARNRFQPRAPARIFLRHPAAPVILLNRTLLRPLVLLTVPRLRLWASLPERKIERRQQRARFLVIARGGAYRDVHAPNVGGLVVIDLREHDVFLDAERVIAAAVETLRIEPTEVAYARQRDIDEAVEKLVHARLAQCHLAADGLAGAQLVSRDRLARLGDNCLLPGDESEIGGGPVHFLAVGNALADAHIDDDLVDERGLKTVLVAELRGELGPDRFVELHLETRRHARLGLARCGWLAFLTVRGGCLVRPRLFSRLPVVLLGFDSLLGTRR